MPRAVLLVLLCLCLTVPAAGSAWMQTRFVAPTALADMAMETDAMHTCCADDDAQPSAPDCHKDASCTACMHAHPLLTAPALPAVAQLPRTLELPAWWFSAHAIRGVPHQRPPING